MAEKFNPGLSGHFHHNLFVDIYWAELYTMFTGVENKKCFCLVFVCWVLADWIATLAVKV